MKTLKIMEVEKEKIDLSSLYISELINQLLEHDKGLNFIDGIFYIGSNFSGPVITLTIVYNHHNFAYDEGDIIKTQNHFKEKTGIDLRIDKIASWHYKNEKSRRVREDYPIEFNLRYGTILYDKCSRLKRIKDILEQDKNLEDYIDYWTDVRELEPKIEYTKRKIS